MQAQSAAVIAPDVICCSVAWLPLDRLPRMANAEPLDSSTPTRPYRNAGRATLGLGGGTTGASVAGGVGVSLGSGSGVRVGAGVGVGEGGIVGEGSTVAMLPGVSPPLTFNTMRAESVACPDCTVIQSSPTRSRLTAASARPPIVFVINGASWSPS